MDDNEVEVLECTCELRVLERVNLPKEFTQENLDNAARFIALGGGVEAYSTLFPDKVKAILDRGGNLRSHVSVYAQGRLVQYMLGNHPELDAPKKILQQKWVSDSGDFKWVDVLVVSVLCV